MAVPSQEYDCCFQFVWYASADDFTICKGIFCFELSLDFDIFVILLFLSFRVDIDYNLW